MQQTKLYSSARPFKSIVITALVLVLTACGHTPREVTSNVPLVTQAQAIEGYVIPNKYWKALSYSATTMLPHQEYVIDVFELYTSSLGNTCRMLSLTAKKTHEKQHRVACRQTIQGATASSKHQAPWLLTNDIIVKNQHITW